MFTWLNKQGVRSDEGFEFQFTGRFTAEFRENGRVTELAVEDMASGARPGVAISVDSLAPLWLSWPDAWREQRRAKILKNVREAVEFQGLTFELG
jgi:hypothetical protein